MDALASYGSDSEDSDSPEIKETETHGDTKSLFSKLPESSVGSSNLKRLLPDAVDETLEPIVQKHSWEIEEAPKPPPKTKRVGPVKIVLPELTDPSLSDEEEDQSSKPAPKLAFGSSVKLLSMLPAPKVSKPTPGKGKILVPTAVSRPKPVTVAKPKISKNRKKPEIFSKIEENTSDTEESVDFLGLSNKNCAVLPEFGPSKAPENDDISEEFMGPSSSNGEHGGYVHPVQMYNYAAPVTQAQKQEEGMTFFPTEEDQAQTGITNERAKNLIYKNEFEKWGIAKEEMGAPSIVDVNVNQSLGSSVERQAQLMKNLHGGPMGPVPRTSERDKGKNDPGYTAKRKHQITYLAFMAKQREEELKEQWSTSRFNRNQSRNKYGF